MLTNANAPFATGDVLDIFIDTDLAVDTPTSFFGETAGMSVTLNGVNYPFIGSNLILIRDPVNVSIQRLGPQICIGDSYLNFDIITINDEWPYAKYKPEPNHYSCVINPPTCDLIVVGIPEVTPATSETATDGSITVTASSTNPIQYKLGSDFSYGDGSGQSDGIFSGLLPGSYRVYLRDSANCAVSVLITISVNNTYAPKFRIDYKDVNGEQTRLDILKRGYSGSITEVTCGASPVQISLRGEGDVNKFLSLTSTQSVINLESLTSDQFFELYTSDPNLYRLHYYKGLGTDLKLVHKLLPNQYMAEWRRPPFGVSVTCTDALAELADFYLIQDDGQKYTGTIKLVKLLAYCLNRLTLDLPIRIACNLYAVDMDQTDADDPFDQAYIDFETFYINEREPKLDFVLHSILAPFGCRITQWEGRWNIVRVEEMVDVYDYRDFDKDGEYISNGAFDPCMNLDTPANVGQLLHENMDLVTEMRPGYGSVEVTYKLGLKPNILKNGDFKLKSIYAGGVYGYAINKDNWVLVNAGYVLNESYEVIDQSNIAYVISSSDDTITSGNGGEAYLQSDTYQIKMGSNNQMKISIRCKVNRQTVTFGVTSYAIDVPYVKVRLRVKYGSLYLQSDGTWTSNVNNLTFFINEFGKFADFEVLANQPTSGTPVSGMDFDVRVYHAYAYHADFLTKASLEALVTYSEGNQVIPSGYRTELRTGGYMYYYELEDSSASTSGFDVVEPDDWHATNNPRKYILKDKKPASGGVLGTNVFPFIIDKIVTKFLTGGQDPQDAIIRSIKGEVNNKSILEKSIIIGSYSNLIVSENRFGIDLGAFFPYQPGLTITSTSILSADTIYAGYLRDVDGVGFEYFARDGVSESDKLHGILLKSCALQYRKSWRLLRGSFYAREYFGFLNVIRHVNDSNRIYLPIGMTYDDKMCSWNGEALELVNINSNPGSDGSGGSPYTSAFSTGFGQSAFN